MSKAFRCEEVVNPVHILALELVFAFCIPGKRAQVVKRTGIACLRRQQILSGTGKPRAIGVSSGEILSSLISA